jgi:hypothetical protein
LRARRAHATCYRLGSKKSVTSKGLLQEPQNIDCPADRGRLGVQVAKSAGRRFRPARARQIEQVQGEFTGELRNHPAERRGMQRHAAACREGARRRAPCRSANSPFGARSCAGWQRLQAPDPRRADLQASGFGLGPGVSLRGRWGWFELQGTALAEVLPWAGGGSHEKLYERDYHYGPGAEGILDVRALFGNRVILDVVIREFLVSSWYATESSEDVTWGQMGITARLVGLHAIAVSAGWARRRASYPLAADVRQGGGVLVATYTLLRGW